MAKTQPQKPQKPATKSRQKTNQGWDHAVEKEKVLVQDRFKCNDYIKKQNKRCHS